MRLGLVVAVVATLAAGCGGDAPERSETVERLAELCTEARLDIEKLGLPGEKGIAVVRPWANRGTRLAETIGGLEGGTTDEQRLVGRLATALDEYYAGLRVGLLVYEQTKSSEAYAAAVERSTAFLEESEEVAREIGAPECATRPFAGD